MYTIKAKHEARTYNPWHGYYMQCRWMDGWMGEEDGCEMIWQCTSKTQTEPILDSCTFLTMTTPYQASITTWIAQDKLQLIVLMCNIYTTMKYFVVWSHCQSCNCLVTFTSTECVYCDILCVVLTCSCCGSLQVGCKDKLCILSLIYHLIVGRRSS